MPLQSALELAALRQCEQLLFAEVLRVRAHVPRAVLQQLFRFAGLRGADNLHDSRGTCVGVVAGT